MHKITLYELKAAMDTAVISEFTSYVRTQTGEVAKTGVVVSEPEFQTPEWVTDQVKLGMIGEGIAERFLIDQYGNVRNITGNSNKGYDLEVGNLRVEVKTTVGYGTAFFLSSNELEKALQFGEEYMIFFIQISKAGDVAVGHPILNPVKTLDLPVETMLLPVTTRYRSIRGSSYHIELTQNFLEEQEAVSLTSYLLREHQLFAK